MQFSGFVGPSGVPCVSTVHSESLNTCSDEGVEVVGVGVMIKEESVQSTLSSGMLNVKVSTSLSLRSARLRLGKMEVLKNEAYQLIFNLRLVHNSCLSGQN